MFRFLANLFAADTARTTRTPVNTFRPQVTGMEDRSTPASLVATAFDPQPEPPTGTRTAAVSTSTTGTTSIPGVYIPGVYIPGVYVPGPGYATRG